MNYLKNMILIKYLIYLKTLIYLVIIFIMKREAGGLYDFRKIFREDGARQCGGAFQFSGLL